MRRLTSALLTLLLLSAAAFPAAVISFADEDTVEGTDTVTAETGDVTEPVADPPVSDEPVVVTTEEPEPVTTPEPVTDPAPVTTPEPVTTTKEPDPVTTPEPVTTTRTPEPMTSTEEPDTEEPVTKEPVTEEPVTEEPPVITPPEDEEPDEPEEDEDRDTEEPNTSATSKRPSATDEDVTSALSGEGTADVTSVSEKSEDVFSDKKMFATPLEAVSFFFGILVIIFVFITLFTIARRIVKKYTSGK